MSASGNEKGSWELFEHDADIGLRAEAASREGLFELMGEALTGVVTAPETVEIETELSIRCEAPEDALLLADWLNALIYEMATRDMLCGAWDVKLDGQCLEARVRGEAVDRSRHQPAVEIKGATYTGLEVERMPDGMWRAQCIVDV